MTDINNNRIIDGILDCICEAGYKFSVEQDDDYFFDFRIKQCKGWLFGIRPGRENTCFFCQCEQEINKFKPSRSAYALSVNNENLFSESIFVAANEIRPILQLIKFIHNHPIRAWYRNLTGVDYNIEYRSAFTVWRRYIRRKFWWKRYYSGNKILDSIMLRFVKRKIVPYLKEDFDKVEIVYQGANTYPKYEIYCYTSDKEMKQGCYSIFGDGEELESEWNAMVDKLYKISKRFRCHWSCPFNYSILVRNAN